MTNSDDLWGLLMPNTDRGELFQTVSAKGRDMLVNSRDDSCKLSVTSMLPVTLPPATFGYPCMQNQLYAGDCKVFQAGRLSIETFWVSKMSLTAKESGRCTPKRAKYGVVAGSYSPGDRFEFPA